MELRVGDDEAEKVQSVRESGVGKALMCSAGIKAVPSGKSVCKGESQLKPNNLRFFKQISPYLSEEERIDMMQNRQKTTDSLFWMKGIKERTRPHKPFLRANGGKRHGPIGTPLASPYKNIIKYSYEGLRSEENGQ